MTQFEDLPRNVRVLLLAKLALEMNKYQCVNIYELAKKRHTDVTTYGVSSARCRGSHRAPFHVKQRKRTDRAGRNACLLSDWSRWESTPLVAKHGEPVAIFFHQ
jgi:hypothetical protein